MVLACPVCNWVGRLAVMPLVRLWAGCRGGCSPLFDLGAPSGGLHRWPMPVEVGLFPRSYWTNDIGTIRRFFGEPVCCIVPFDT